jgi:hypothetical protein
MVFRYFAILASTLVLGTASLAQTDRSVSVAREAFFSGRYSEADSIVSDLLARDPKDADALAVRSALLLQRGRTDAALEAAALSYRNASSDRQRFEAAMLAARSALADERFIRARLWLLRAEGNAESERRRRDVAEARAAVARIDPLSVQLRFAAAPSNNVNNGAEVTTIDIGGLPFVIDDSGRQLSGYYASGGVALSYRIQSTDTSRIEALIEGYAREVWLSSEAEALAPGVQGRDFDHHALLAGLRHTRLVWPELGPTQVTLVTAYERYGHRSHARWQEVQGLQAVNRGEAGILRLGVRARRTERFDDPINDSVTLGIFGDLMRRAASGTETHYGAYLTSTESDGPTVDNLALGVSTARDLPPLGEVRPRIAAGIEARDYREWTISPGGRRDDTAYVNVDLMLPAGPLKLLSPTISLAARRTWSSVDIYDRNELSVSFTLISRW